MSGRTVLVIALACVVSTGCFSRRGGEVGPFPAQVVPGTIVFASSRDEGHGEIYSMKDDGTSVQRLTFNAVTDGTPVLSPDGTKILFRRELNPTNVFVMNVDGTSEVGLSPGKRAEWSPDGKKIAVLADSIAIMNSDATGRVWLHVGASLVSWSPDGTKLAYVSNGLNGQVIDEIYTVSTNGGGAVRITHDGVAKNSLQWSPDGTKFVYSAAGTVYVINADGTGLSSPVQGRDARWSPDGTRIIFVTDAFDGNEEIYTARLDGSDPKNLSNNPANESEPDWGK
ncbi:MAG: TolB family protein [Bacteroidota bacterium]